MSSADNGTRPNIDDPDLLRRNIQRNIDSAVVNCVPKMKRGGKSKHSLQKNELEHVQQKRKKRRAYLRREKVKGL